MIKLFEGGDHSVRPKNFYPGIQIRRILNNGNGSY